MTTRTPQCEVFWPFNSSSEFSGVPEDSKFPLLGMWASPPHLAQSGVAIVKLAIWLPTFFFAITYILGVQMGHVSPFQTSKFQELSNDIRNFSIQWVLTLQSPSKDSRVHRNSNSQNGSLLGSVRVHSFTLSFTPENMRCDSQASLLACNLVSPCFGREPKVRVVTLRVILEFFLYCLLFMTRVHISFKMFNISLSYDIKQ
jgi:hypothetical protein